MIHHLKAGIFPAALIFLFLNLNAQSPAFNQNSSRSNNAKSSLTESEGWNFGINTGTSFGINSNENTLFRGNSLATKMFGSYYPGKIGLGMSGGFIPGKLSQGSIDNFISERNYQQSPVSSSDPFNGYLMFGPTVKFGERIKVLAELQGGMFLNNPGSLTIGQSGAVRPLYRYEAGDKSLFPGFSGNINLAYPMNSSTTFFINSEYLQTKSSIIIYDPKNGIDIPTEQSRDVKLMNFGIGISKSFGRKENASGMATGKTSAMYNPKEYSVTKKYQPGQPTYGNLTNNESCGPVTVKKTFGDGSTEEMTFACPADAASYNQRTGDYSERPVWTSSNTKRTFAAPHVFEQKGSVSGRVSWTSLNTGIGIVTNKTIRGGSANLNSQTSSTRTTPSTSFGTMVRLSAREAGTGMATGKLQYEPVFTEGQVEVCNPCLVTVSNPVYKGGMGNAQSNPMYVDKNNQGVNPMYEDKARISAPDDCDDSDPGIADLKVSLVDVLTGQVVATTKTEKCGDFFFANVPNGDYKIQLNGMISGKKGYDFYMKKKAEMDGQIVWDGESVDLTLYSNEEISAPSMRAGISTSRSNIRTKSITIIDADTDGDGAFDSFRAIASLSDGSTKDITEDASASRVNKIDAFTIKQKAFNKMHRLTRGKTSSSLQLTGITFTNGENNNFKANATFSDGSSFDITNAVAVNSSSPAVRQYTIVAGDLDDDGNADAVLKITKSRSNIQNNRMADGSSGNNGNEMEGVKIGKSRSNIQNNRSIKGEEDDDDQELGVVKTKTKSNQSNDRMAEDNEIWSPRSNILTYAIVAGDLDGDGKAEAAINTSHSNIKNNRISVADTDGDGVAEATVNTSRSNIKHLRMAIGDIDGDGYSEMLVGGMMPGGAVISSALRTPGEPIPGIDVKITKKNGGNEKSVSSDANGKIKAIGPDMEPDTYEMSINLNFYIEDETFITVGNDDAEDIAVNEEGAERSSGIKQTMQTQVKWKAPETTKTAINNSHSNIKNLFVSVDELEQMLNTDNSSAKTAINNSHSNIKNLRAAAITLENTMDNMETMEREAAMSEVKNNMAAMNMQFLALQESLNKAGKQYTTISNVLKTKHDTVKNSINNVR